MTLLEIVLLVYVVSLVIMNIGVNVIDENYSKNEKTIVKVYITIFWGIISPLFALFFIGLWVWYIGMTIYIRFKFRKQIRFAKKYEKAIKENEDKSKV